jgi:hypothetical protein
LDRILTTGQCDGSIVEQIDDDAGPRIQRVDVARFVVSGIFDAQHDLRGDSREIIVFTDTAPPYNERTRRIGMTWTFRVEESVFESARIVAAWIRENEASLVA